MNNVKFVFFLSVLLFFTAFKADNGTGEKDTSYEIIANGSSYQVNFGCDGFFTVNDRQAYDALWIKLYGDLSEQPFFNMNDYKLIVIPGELTIDAITESSECISVYVTAPPPISSINDHYSQPLSYAIIRIPYTFKSVKLMQKESPAPPPHTQMHLDANK